MLMGNFQNSIDGKNRISVPAKFRNELGDSCVLTKGLDGCLELYPADAWQKKIEKYSSLPMSDPKARTLMRYIFGSAYEVEIDKQGRTVVPQVLKDFAKLDKEMVAVGMINHVEFWDKECYENSSRGGMIDLDELDAIGQQYQV